MKETIFAKILRGEVPCHKVWEDDNHLAFLDIFPPVEGMTLVIPKDYHPGNIFKMPADRLQALAAAVHHVGNLLMTRLPCERPVWVFEGLEVDHAHAKLYPIYSIDESSKPSDAASLDPYPGYLSTLAGARADEAQLAKLAEKLRGAA